jgi:hypothetical protein
LLAVLNPDGKEDESTEAEAEPGATKQKAQVVLEITLRAWQEAIEAYGIEKSVIPHRESVNLVSEREMAFFSCMRAARANACPLLGRG